MIIKNCHQKLSSKIVINVSKITSLLGHSELLLDQGTKQGTMSPIELFWTAKKNDTGQHSQFLRYLFMLVFGFCHVWNICDIPELLNISQCFWQCCYFINVSYGIPSWNIKAQQRKHFHYLRVREGIQSDVRGCCVPRPT